MEINTKNLLTDYDLKQLEVFFENFKLFMEIPQIKNILNSVEKKAEKAESVKKLVYEKLESNGLDPEDPDTLDSKITRVTIRVNKDGQSENMNKESVTIRQVLNAADKEIRKAEFFKSFMEITGHKTEEGKFTVLSKIKTIINE